MNVVLSRNQRILILTGFEKNISFSYRMGSIEPSQATHELQNRKKKKRRNFLKALKSELCFLP